MMTFKAFNAYVCIFFLILFLCLGGAACQVAEPGFDQAFVPAQAFDPVQASREQSQQPTRETGPGTSADPRAAAVPAASIVGAQTQADADTADAPGSCQDLANFDLGQPDETFIITMGSVVWSAQAGCRGASSATLLARLDSLAERLEAPAGSAKKRSYIQAYVSLGAQVLRQADACAQGMIAKPTPGPLAGAIPMQHPGQAAAATAGGTANEIEVRAAPSSARPGPGPAPAVCNQDELEHATRLMRLRCARRSPPWDDPRLLLLCAKLASTTISSSPAAPRTP